ncbi:MAG: VCBS repeat-containing protein, partial [Marinilabiliales bacterium]|nr:VCBS repeat-containing protein [Marinilabiliales bacterium]
MKLNYPKGILLLVLLIALQSGLIAGNGALQNVWKYTAPEAGGAGIPQPFPDAKHPNSLIISGGKMIIRLSSTGKEMFAFSTAENVIVPAVGDVDGDGKAEIVAPTNAGVVYCLDESGKLKWKNDLKDYLYDFGGAVLSDIDGDGHLESLFNARGGTIYCLNFDGSLRWKVKAEPRA